MAFLKNINDISPESHGKTTIESVYEALHDRYLFQLRGHHYLEDVGEFSTYLLGGRL